MEEAEAPITVDTFKGQLDLLIQFGTRNFYYNISLPNPLWADDLMIDLLDILVSLANHQIDKKNASKKIQTIKNKSASFQEFQNSLSQIIENINSSNSQKFVWELTSNLVYLCLEHLNYVKSSLSLFDIPDEAFLEEQIITLNSQIDILSKCKPEDARESKPISFNLSDPQVGSSFNSFIQAKTTSLPKCCICTEPATWFAFPCSHPVYCELDYNDSLSGDFLYTECPICNKTIEKYINIQFPQ